MAGRGPGGRLGPSRPRRFRERTLYFEPRTTVYQAGLEPWAAYSAIAQVTQAGLEPWALYTPTVNIYQVGLEVWIPASPAPDPINRRAKLGPRGFLGIPPRRFRESRNFAEQPAPGTEVDIYQVGLEPWVQDTPEAQITQVGLEPWVKDVAAVQITQVGIEAWVSVRLKRVRIVNVHIF